MNYEVFIDGNLYDEVEAVDSADACRQVFDRLDGQVGEMHAEPVEGSDEPGICPACNGSGEGQHEGSRCHYCGGWGGSMTKDDIIRMARDCNLERVCGPLDTLLSYEWEYLQRFANLVAAAEREACERAIEELLPDADRGDCATAIRARGTK